jgi:hypothetical protein
MASWPGMTSASTVSSIVSDCANLPKPNTPTS